MTISYEMILFLNPSLMPWCFFNMRSIVGEKLHQHLVFAVTWENFRNSVASLCYAKTLIPTKCIPFINHKWNTLQTVWKVLSHWACFEDGLSVHHWELNDHSCLNSRWDEWIKRNTVLFSNFRWLCVLYLYLRLCHIMS